MKISTTSYSTHDPNANKDKIILFPLFIYEEKRHILVTLRERFPLMIALLVLAWRGVASLHKNT